MAKLLTGREAASALTAALQRRTDALTERGVTPKLAILRCGENESDSAYLRSAQQRAARCGVAVEVTSLPETVTRAALLAAIAGVNRDASVHGCLLLRPLADKAAEEAGASPGRGGRYLQPAAAGKRRGRHDGCLRRRCVSGT